LRFEVPALPPNTPVRVESDAVLFTMPLTKVGTSNLYAGVAQLSHGTAFTWHYLVGDRHLGGTQLEVYETHPDSKEQPGVPKGTVKQMPPWESKIFTAPSATGGCTSRRNTVRSTGGGDGLSGRRRPEGLRADVFDNLIARGTCHHRRHLHSAWHRADGRRQPQLRVRHAVRSVRDASAEEILPEVEKTVKLRHDAAGRAISGASSGGICAFTVAWERPERVQQGAVLDRQLHQHRERRDSACGRPQLRGAGPQDAEEADPCLLQDGATISTTRTATGRWRTRRSRRRLSYAKYDYRFEFGRAFHSNRHGRAISPDSLRWLGATTNQAARKQKSTSQV
jgi:enterochelin esterase family protein